MHISQRTLHIPTSPIRKLAPIANRVEKTKKIYHLNIGQPDIPTPESFFEGVASYHQSGGLWKIPGGCQTAESHPGIL